jgi:hypothetical protein|tara:strand:- start:111 stop:1289 length:1179 start_codon:yes stop_codon:yes gene_type:complete
MPLPKRNKDESRENFMSRCMSSDKSKKEFPDQSQRVAVCMSQAMDGLSSMAAADFKYNFEELGYTEALNEDNFYVPLEDEYVDFEDGAEEWDISVAKPGLWENIRKKKEREGKNYKPARTEKEGRPSQKELKEAQSYGNPKKAKSDKPSKSDPRRTPAPKKDQKRGSKKNKPDSAKNPSGKITFSKEVTAQLSKKVKDHNAKGKGSKATLGMLKAVYRRGAGAYSTSHAPKMSRHGWAIARVNAFLTLLRTGKPSNSNYKQDNDLLPKGHPRKSKADAGYKYQDPKTGEIYEFARKGVYTKDGRTLIPAYSAEYQGRKVTLNKPFRTPDGPKKFAVYTKNGSGKVVIVRFGDPNMEIKKDNPKRRKSFRARHKCDTAPGPKWKARYWSCRMW